MVIPVMQFSWEGYKIDFESQILALFDTSPVQKFAKSKDFIATIFLILYPSLENSTTGIAILYGVENRRLALYKKFNWCGKLFDWPEPILSIAINFLL
jgi:hypothetical protein